MALPEAGDRAIDQPGIALAKPLVADAEPVEHAGAKRLQQHVRVLREAQQDLLGQVGEQNYLAEQIKDSGS